MGDSGKMQGPQNDQVPGKLQGTQGQEKAPGKLQGTQTKSHEKTPGKLQGTQGERDASDARGLEEDGNMSDWTEDTELKPLTKETTQSWADKLRGGASAPPAEKPEEPKISPPTTVEAARAAFAKAGLGSRPPPTATSEPLVAIYRSMGGDGPPKLGFIRRTLQAVTKGDVKAVMLWGPFTAEVLVPTSKVAQARETIQAVGRRLWNGFNPTENNSVRATASKGQRVREAYRRWSQAADSCWNIQAQKWYRDRVNKLEREFSEVLTDPATDSQVGSQPQVDEEGFTTVVPKRKKMGPSTSPTSSESTSSAPPQRLENGSPSLSI